MINVENPKRINCPFISDLWFNTDHSASVIKDQKGRFDGWDFEKMKEDADSFRLCMSGLGIITPRSDKLIEDLLARL
jgi:hypothetical protein